MTYVLYEKQDHVAVITFNRPDRMNALGRELAAELRDAETRFAEDNDAWVGVYTGAGDRAFCAGRDLKEVASSAAGSGAAITPRFDRIAPDIGKPTIAAVNGAAYGGGMERALACDIRICSENATFALAEVKVGLCPPTGGFALPRLIGLSNSMWMLLGGEPVDAEEALRMGLVSKVVPQSELMPTALQATSTEPENGSALRLVRRIQLRGLLERHDILGSGKQLRSLR